MYNFKRGVLIIASFDERDVNCTKVKCLNKRFYELYMRIKFSKRIPDYTIMFIYLKIVSFVEWTVRYHGDHHIHVLVMTHIRINFLSSSHSFRFALVINYFLMFFVFIIGSSEIGNGDSRLFRLFGWERLQCSLFCWTLTIMRCFEHWTFQKVVASIIWKVNIFVLSLTVHYFIKWWFHFTFRTGIKLKAVAFKTQSDFTLEENTTYIFRSNNWNKIKLVNFTKEVWRSRTFTVNDVIEFSSTELT